MPINKHIFLTHGAFSNKKICYGIAAYLTEKGYTCWVMEWRNHGESSKPNQMFNFETLAKYDFKSIFEFLFETQNLKNIDCIAHSGGGIGLTLFLINYPNYNSKINSVTFFGVQAFGAAEKQSSRLKIVIGKYLSAILGKVPSLIVGSTEQGEPYQFMKQWFDWNLNKNFSGENGIDYLKQMNKINIPILSICAKGDHFIATKTGCEKFLNAFENSNNKLLYLSKENGNLEDYNHSRIFKSQNSKKEIWPSVLQWILQHQTIANTCLI